MKKLLTAMVLALAASLASAQTPQTLLYGYNLNQTVTPTYCALTGAKIITSDRITAANSTTVTAVSGAPFANVAVGAMLHFVDINGTDYRRGVTIRTSSTSIVVSGPAITVTSAQIQQDSQNVKCGSTPDVGAFTVPAKGFLLQIDISQVVTDGSGIKFNVVCRNSGSARWPQQFPTLVYPAVAYTYTSALDAVGQLPLTTTEPFFQCAVGMFITTADDASDVSTAAEQIAFYLTPRQ